MQLTREQAGGYLCVASNGHPPAVSRRFQLHVKFREDYFNGHPLAISRHEFVQRAYNGWQAYDFSISISIEGFELILILIFSLLLIILSALNISVASTLFPRDILVLVTCPVLEVLASSSFWQALVY